jgi:hypothetical protein
VDKKEIISYYELTPDRLEVESYSYVSLAGKLKLDTVQYADG